MTANPLTMTNQNGAVLAKGTIEAELPQ